MKFNVLSFLHQHRIAYISKGVNVKKGEININCPFCAKTASPDPSFHLGIDEERLQFSCWRNKRKHAGRTLHKLIMELAKCSYEQACTLLGHRPIWLEENVFEHLFDEKAVAQKSELTLLDSFQALDPEKLRHQRFAHYLTEDRGYGVNDLYRLSRRYSLQVAISGSYKDRIIVPNYIQSRLVNWTGRSIYPNASLRYLSLDASHGALVSIKECLFNEKALFAGGQLLVVTEGPFDAMKVDFYGAAYGVRATCLFNKKATVHQLGCLGELCNLFDRIVVMFDQGEVVDQLAFISQMEWTGRVDWVVDWDCPSHVKDPGELSKQDVKHLCTQMSQCLLRS